MTTIKPEQFEDYIISLMGKYSNDVVEKTVTEKVTQIGKEAKIVVKGYSKANDQLYQTGAYQKGWGISNKRIKGLKQVKVYNKKKPSLVHLLELGHRIAGTNRYTRKFPHVSPTELAYNKKLYEELRRELQ